MNIPQIRLKYGWHLDNAFDMYLSKITEKQPTHTKDEVLSIMTQYKNEWSKFESKILEAMTEILNLGFNKNIIDVYIVGNYRKAFSDPLVVSSKYDPDVFVDILTHEILHIILTDNDKKLNVSEIWKKMFPDVTDVKTLNHIVVHAVHKEIYLNKLKDESRFTRDIEGCQKFKSYKDAWDIVEKNGHLKIIEDFKKNY